MTASTARHDEWVRIYLEERISCGKIAERYGVTERAVAQVLIKRNIPRRTPNRNAEGAALRPHHSTWATMYQQGQSLEEIGAAFGVDQNTVHRAIKRLGVECRDYVESHRKYELRNEHAFDRIDADEKAYFLGLLMADGNVQVGISGENSGRVAMSLHEDDRVLVEALKSFLGADVPVHKHHFKPRGDYGESDQVSVHIHSRIVADSLIRCGCIPRKSLVLEFPPVEIVPIKWLGAFARGYLDGDGCVGGRANRPGSAIVTFTTGSKTFANGLWETLNSLGFPMRLQAYKGGKAYHVVTERRSCVEALYHWMYSGATVYLPRKKAKFEELLGITTPSTQGAAI